MADLSDTQIRSDLRTLFVEAGVDPNQASMLCASGVVRVLGDLLRLHDSGPVRPQQVDALEQSIRRSRGVRRVHFHVDGWKQLPTGEWVRAEQAGVRGEHGGAARPGRSRG